MRVLVTGGAGYIGSQTVKELRREGFEPVVVDNLSTGHRESVKGAELHEFSVADRDRMLALLRERPVEAVIHFAAFCYVGESMEDPLRYYRNNVAGSIHLLEALIESGVRKFVFSSTCATYGEPVAMPLREDHPQHPVNVYGDTKLAVERMLLALGASHGLRSVILRYFNAAGADPEGELGEDHEPETHLIPLVLQVPLGRRKQVRIFGDDYDTPDGTCIRDYIHTVDLARAHILSLRYLADGGPSDAFNVGIGRGYSVREVVECARRVTGHVIPEIVEERRPGDPARLVAGSEKIRTALSWEPRFPDLEAIVRTAWSWHNSRPRGYAV
ncbi:MAG: UDP-glucose 4-epimerase GalE [Candidatus Latescibacterota bacterium]|nr:MAG: UDP-glucose 4-epimerase GalE [Candidatus Latescibacterota bacterium]